jgi:transposase
VPKKDCILDLPGFSIIKVTRGNPMVIDVNYRRKAQCPYCYTRKLRKKTSFMRTVRHESFGHRRTVLRFKAYKFYCAACCRYFNQRFPGIGKHQRASERLHNQVFHQHTQGISQKDLAVNLKLGKATIERWYHKSFWLKNQQLQNRHCPQVLGIDEHFFSKKQGYATTLCDLAKHKVFDVVKGRSALELKDYLHQLKGRERVKVVCMDLSSTYRHLVRQYFPQAKIVADRFHVIRQLLQSCLQTYQSIDPQMKHQRGLLAALRTCPNNLSPKRLQVRDNYLKQQPAISAIYDFKQQLYQLLVKKTMKAKRCKRYLPVFLRMIQALKQSPFKQLKTLGKTLYQWQEEIVRMWRFSKSNGITEGFHRKMKLIQRRAYGFRNFENYRLRVKVLCS